MKVIKLVIFAVFTLGMMAPYHISANVEFKEASFSPIENFESFVYRHDSEPERDVYVSPNRYLDSSGITEIIYTPIVDSATGLVFFNLSFILNEAGMEALRDLIKVSNRNGSLMAVIVDGQVISVADLYSPPSRNSISLAEKFSESEAMSIVEKFRKSRPVQPQQTVEP